MRRKTYTAADEKLAALSAKESADKWWKHVFEEYQKGTTSQEDLWRAMDRCNQIDWEILSKYGNMDIS